MTDLLAEALRGDDPLWGVLCRDASVTDLELMRRAGYGIVWFDLEHGPMTIGDAMRLSRTAEHLGLVTAVRIPEASRAYVQPLLDQGVRILILPDVAGVDHAAGFVKLARFPPLGYRGASSVAPWNGFISGPQLQAHVPLADAETHLMVQFESDEALLSIDEILRVPGIDMVTVGPLDWRIRASRNDNVHASVMTVLKKAAAAGKVTAIALSGSDDVRAYRALGVRLLFVGVDIALKAEMFRDTLARFRRALG